MKAIVIVNKQGKDIPDLEYVTVPDPTPENHELLIRVKSAGLNRIDLRRSVAQVNGKPQIPGLELSGEVIAAGDQARGFCVGDRVMGMTTGAYAELATIDYRFAMKIPQNFTYDQACAVATVYPTAHDALVTNGGFTAGKSILVQGAGTAVGIATVQIAKAMGAKVVIGTGTSESKEPKLKKLGLDRFIHSKKHNVAEEVLEVTGGLGIDIVIDMVGGSALMENLEAVTPGGRIVNV